MKKVLLASLALLLLAFFALPAMASITGGTNTGTLVTPVVVDPGVDHYNINGIVNDIGQAVRLFEPPEAGPGNTAPALDNLWGQNNTSPIAYPENPAYAPSPGGSAGEAFDIEGLLWRYNPGNNELRVWVVTSIQPYVPGSATLNGADYVGGNHYALGDVFINTDGVASTGTPHLTGGDVGGYDYALISFDSTTAANGPQHWVGTGRDAGDLVSLTSTSVLSGANGNYSYGNPQATEVYPWAVRTVGDANTQVVPGSGNNNLVYEEITGTDIMTRDDTYVDSSNVEHRLWSNVGLTGPTYVYFFDVFVDLDNYVQNLFNPLNWHVTVQCANDLGHGSDGNGGGGRVPVPGALILGIIGAGLVGLRRRMKA